MLRVSGLTEFFQRVGASAHEAKFRAFSAIDQILNGQAALQSFDDLFRYVGLAFMFTLPLVLLLGRGGSKEAAAEAH